MSGILLNELEKNRDLAKAFDRIYQESLKIWDQQYLRKYTAHGRRHTEQVERNLDDLTRPLQNSKERLSDEEIFVLLSATCLHDLGMQTSDDPDARSLHAQHAYDLILHSECRVTLPIDDWVARMAIANVARAHWTDHALKLPQQDFINDRNYVGRLRLLGLLLAMADLLDLSPIRAGYFRATNQLHDHPSESGLHPTMSQLVKGTGIGPPKPNIPAALQFKVEWADNSDEVHLINDWLIQWFSSQWMQLQGPLYEASGGIIHWTQPWVKVIFNEPQGPIKRLSPEALKLLKAQRAEQLRIDRNVFARRFLEALRNKETTILVPGESDFDWNRLIDWCEVQAISPSPSIFISYAHEDKAFAQRLTKDLEKAGMRVWLDERELQLGDSLIEAIRRGIDETDYFAVLISPAAVKSTWVRKELDVAMNREIDGRRVTVLPLILKECELPGFLKGKVYADFASDYEHALAQLLRRLGLREK